MPASRRSRSASLFDLKAAELPVALRIIAVALLIPVLTRMLSLPRLASSLDSTRARRPPSELERTVWLVRGMLGRRIGPIRPGCYRQALILFHLLRREGRPATVVFGVRREGDDLAGHGWVELAGEPVAEPADPRSQFEVTFSFPEPPIR